MPLAVRNIIQYSPLEVAFDDSRTSSYKHNMAPTTLVLWIAIGFLMIDSIIELSFITSMVSWLHRRAGGSFEVIYNGTTFYLHGKPLNLLLDQGHTSNGAAGTAFVLVGIGGILALVLRARAHRRPGTVLSKFGLILYHVWLIFTLLSALLTLAALIYVFVVTSDHNGQLIDVKMASTLHNEPYPNYVAYPLEVWTPENWFNAVLKLDLVSSTDRSDIQSHLVVMRGWRWNLIPMLILGLSVTLLAFTDAFVVRGQIRQKRQYQGYDQSKRIRT